MLYQYGSVQFTVTGLNPHEVKRTAAADFAAKDVIGALRPLEAMGEGENVIKLTCKVFTQVNDAGLGDMDTLDQMMLAQDPNILVRGDGTNLGWRVITQIEECSRKLDLSGVGKIIEFEMALRKAPKPNDASMLSQLFGVAGGSLSGLFSSLRG